MSVPESQRRICERFSVVPDPPAAGTMVGIAPSRPHGMLPLNALRHPAAGRSNGWFVWRGGEIPQDQDDFFVPLHVEHLPDHVPELVPYLALPPGWRVLLAPGYEDVWFDESCLNV
jgi:hypothetical protein